jgi:hypothetical protein
MIVIVTVAHDTGSAKRQSAVLARSPGQGKPRRGDEEEFLPTRQNWQQIFSIVRILWRKLQTHHKPLRQLLYKRPWIASSFTPSIEM